MVDAGTAGAPGLEFLLAAHQSGEIPGGAVLRRCLPSHQGLQVRHTNQLHANQMVEFIAMRICFRFSDWIICCC